MAITIDGLQLEITENSEKAVEGLNALTQSLEKLKKVTSDLGKSLAGVNFDQFGQQIKRLSTALQPLQGFKSQAGSVISSLRYFKDAANEVNQFTEFDKFAFQIKLLAESLQPLANFSTKLGATLNALSQLPTISEQLEAIDFESFAGKITTLTQSLSPLGTIQSKLGATLNQLTRFSQVAQQLDVTLKESNVSTNILTLVKALEPLTTLGKSQLGSFLNQLKKLPEVVNQLATVDINALSEKLNRLATAIKPLADEMNKVAAGFSAFPARIQKLITQSERLTLSNKKLSKSYNILGISFKSIYAKLGVMYLGIKRVANIMSDWVLKSNEYVENLNLFTVAMGKYAGEALEYAQQVQESMGIDMSEWIRNQGIFMQIATGFGVAQDKAYQMSKALTQVSYDISSFFNIPIEEALTKVQAGISGELEPLRRLGYALDAATLQQIAYAHGIELNINRMTQAQKSQLRFIAIMEQSKNVVGDMARTLITPANALRILNQQLLQLRRALGDMIIPLLIKIIPYVQAFVKVLTNAIRSFASFLGFELPQIDYSGLEGLASGANEVSEGLGNATKNAKKLKNVLAPFDEINLLDFADASEDLAENLSGFDLGIDLSQYDYDFLGIIDNKVNDIMQRIKNWFSDFKENPAIKATSTALEFLWTKGLKPLGEWIIANPDKISNFIVSIGAALITYNIVKTIGDIVKFLGGTGGLVDLLGKLAGIVTNPWAVAIAAVAGGITLLATSIATACKEAQEADLANRFGDIALSMEEVKYWAEQLTTTDLTIKLNLFSEESLQIDAIRERIENAVTTLNGYNFRIKLGMEISEAEYKATIDRFIEDSKSYIQQKQVVATIAVEILLEGTATGTRLSEFVSTFYSASYTQLEDLGKQLKDVVNTGFVNNEWIPNKLEQAIELQKEIQKILDYISTVEFEAKIEALRMDFKGVDLTAQSFKDVLKEANLTIEDQLKNLEAVRLENIKIAKMEFDQTGNRAAYEKALEEIENEFENKKLELNFKTFEFGLDTLQEAFRDEIDKSADVFAIGFKEAMQQGYLLAVQNPEDIYDEPIGILMAGLHDAYWFGLNNLDISSAAKENMKKLVAELQPSKKQLEEVAASNLAMGQAVPEYVTKGLRDIAKLEALGGSTDAIAYLIGDKLSTDPAFIETLLLSENAGKQINEHTAKGLMNNLQVVEDASNGTITLINDTIGEKVLEITPVLYENLKALGVNLSEGLLAGTTEQLEKDKPWYVKAWSSIIGWFKNLFGIESPSKVFQEFGNFTMQGLLDGMTGWDDPFKKIFQGIVKGAINILNDFIKWINKAMTFSWKAVVVAGITLVPAGSVQLVNIPLIPIPQYAEGGFPQTGELFIAREAGPELVGSIGRRTAVANNDQIVEAVSQGVYEAVREAMSTQNEQPLIVKVYLEGKQIVNTVEKIQRERGVTLLPGGVMLG